MTTEEVILNPSKSTLSPIAEKNLFPAQLMLPNNECSSEQLAPHVQEKQVYDGDVATIRREEIVETDSPPTQADRVKRSENESNPIGASCNKDIPPEASLRSHSESTSHCNQPDLSSMPKDGKVEPKICLKCGKTFASWQGLRGHLNRVNPCDHDTTVRRRTPVSKTCHKCGRTFSSPQSLRIHLNKMKPCDRDKTRPRSPPEPPATTPCPVLQVMSTEEVKMEQRKVKARYQARKAYLKKRGRLDELGNPPLLRIQSNDGLNDLEKTVNEEEHQREISDESLQDGDSLDLKMSSEAKKPRTQEKVAQEVDKMDDFSSNVIKQKISEPLIPTSSLQDPSKRPMASEGSFFYRLKYDHGGDLLAGGCSCPPCVRRWARNIMNRMQKLEDEVVMLRQQKLVEDKSNNVITGANNASNHDVSLHTRSEKSHVSQPTCPGGMNMEGMVSSKTVVNGHSNASSISICNSVKSACQVPEIEFEKYSDNNPPPSQKKAELASHEKDFCTDQSRLYEQHPISSGLQGLGLDKKSLVEAYTHLNNQILIKERTITEIEAHGDKPELRKKVDELCLFISVEKAKREVMVASLIAREWKSRWDEFRALFEDNTSHNAPHDEQAHHKKWSEISNEVSTKDEAIAELERRMDVLVSGGENTRSRYAEMGELSSKMAAEYDAKMALEGEREEVFVGLVKSSIRIRWLVKNALL
ncbi:Zinc finger, C2H2 [Plasmopara halstedii]|uniref:Zinc finger, C2H2 n=1 Tax=Plasmopara halstedii TaxID=4781 RepID=A0A0N7L565_PLAHL|nr:Zinc finger, C2H2 [Plasmopara halstedii]CEG40611.1 Zinc finger, C2H2 [Plasmopara halstedii]|eukprot:XP_024576980.1 Zinc finger, C2H2 [Plasmopara halstedii]